MEKCNCYHENYSRQECWGTRERDECSCCGDEAKCNFYPEKRAKTQAIETIKRFKAKELRTKELQKAYVFLCDFDSNSEYQKNLTIVLDVLDFALVQNDSLKENLNVLTDLYLNLYNKQKQIMQ